ncbi:hypothetical protein [Paraburkholderia diazotrophica]|uniref:hypothetical protein n=1 Tax=Paraburkholderia diazotrophica TaxID=667676 RepID=UPI0015A69D9C|nr:hypothetical protein [Paraburkholderia diazotrophica]
MAASFEGRTQPDEFGGEVRQVRLKVSVEEIANQAFQVGAGKLRNVPVTDRRFHDSPARLPLAAASEAAVTPSGAGIAGGTTGPTLALRGSPYPVTFRFAPLILPARSVFRTLVMRRHGHTPIALHRNTGWQHEI